MKTAFSISQGSFLTRIPSPTGRAQGHRSGEKPDQLEEDPGPNCACRTRGLKRKDGMRSVFTCICPELLQVVQAAAAAAAAENGARLTGTTRKLHRSKFRI